MAETTKTKRLGLLNFLEDKFLSIGLASFNEFEISEKFEELLYERYMSGDIYIYSETLPLYINSNWESIKKQILDNEGGIKIATYEKPKLPKLIKNSKLLENIKIYRLDKKPDFSISLLYNSYEIASNNQKKFFLKEHVPWERVQDYEVFFRKANLKLQKINPEDCF